MAPAKESKGPTLVEVEFEVEGDVHGNIIFPLFIQVVIIIKFKNFFNTNVKIYY